MPTLEQFLQGAPLAYRSFSGALLTARYSPNGDLLATLIIRDAHGKPQAAPIMDKTGARNFYESIAADPTAAI